MDRPLGDAGHLRRRQRGVAMVFGAVAAVLGLIAVGLTIDLSRLYFTQRQLQSTANMAALDAARVAGGCLGRDRLAGDPMAAARREALGAIARNQGQAGWLSSDGLQLGRLVVTEESLRRFQRLDDAPDSQRYNAVQVRLDRETPSRLIPGLTAGDTTPGAMSSVAAAISRPAARFGVGSGLAEVNLDDSVLGDLLGTVLGGAAPSISLLDYRNLFSSTITLQQLSAEITPGTIAQAVDRLIEVDGLLLAIAGALGDTVDAAAALTVTTLAAATTVTEPVLPRELLGLQTGIEEGVGDLVLNVGTLVSQVLRETATGLVNGLLISLPCPIGQCTGSITILSPGSEEIASPVLVESTEEDAFAQNAQVQLEVIGLSVPLGALGELSVNLTISAAPAQARISDIQCPRVGLPHGQVTLIGETGLANIALDIRGDLLNGAARVRLQASIPVGSTAGGQQALVFNGPFDPVLGEPSQRIGSPPIGALGGTLAALGSGALEIEILGQPTSGLLGGVLGGVASLTEPVLRTVLEQAGVAALLAEVLQGVGDQIDPLLGALGVQLGYADFRVYALTDAQPVLFLR